jgi:lytic murein transglycosylase
MVKSRLPARGARVRLRACYKKTAGRAVLQLNNRDRVPMRPFGVVLACALAIVGMAAAPASAASCGGNFNAWLQGFSQEAAAQGISQRTIGAALAGLSPNPQVLSLDRNQHATFKKSFEQFSATRVTPFAVKKGKSMLARYGPVLRRIEQQYGVPGPVVVAIWGLESGFGAVTGNLATVRSLATLAHDCRRSEKFTEELMAALKIIDRGDLSPGEMRGAWAGELGQTQFLPSSYLKFAVDYDGNGKRDLIRSVPDVLASTANYLRGYGWRKGQPWGEGSANFQVLLEWNKSQVYSQTVAYFASRLAGGN